MSLNTFFTQSVVDGISIGTDIFASFAYCLATALVVGLFVAWTYTIKNTYTRSFVLTLAVLPAMVATVILMVNGNVGAGVAVAGAFSLVRFRSAAGTAKEIAAIFLAMTSGLMIGMGYLGLAVIFVLVVSLVNVVLMATSFGLSKETEKTLTITIPEDLDYSDVFDDLFGAYTKSHELVQVKTTNMGSMFKITYRVDLKGQEIEKQFIDDLRCRNGNLEIMITRTATTGEL